MEPQDAPERWRGIRLRRHCLRHGPQHGALRAAARRALQIGQHDDDVGPVPRGFFEQRCEVGFTAALKAQRRQRAAAGLEVLDVTHAVVADDEHEAGFQTP